MVSCFVLLAFPSFEKIIGGLDALNLFDPDVVPAVMSVSAAVIAHSRWSPWLSNCMLGAGDGLFLERYPSREKKIDCTPRLTKPK